jgi:hypothetical protein
MLSDPPIIPGSGEYKDGINRDSPGWNRDWGSREHANRLRGKVVNQDLSALIAFRIEQDNFDVGKFLPDGLAEFFRIEIGQRAIQKEHLTKTIFQMV